MKVELWTNREILEAMYVAEGPIIHSWESWLFLEALRNQCLLRSYSNSLGLFTSGLNLNVITNFERRARDAIIEV